MQKKQTTTPHRNFFIQSMDSEDTKLLFSIIENHILQTSKGSISIDRSMTKQIYVELLNALLSHREIDLDGIPTLLHENVLYFHSSCTKALDEWLKQVFAPTENQSEKVNEEEEKLATDNHLKSISPLILLKKINTLFIEHFKEYIDPAVKEKSVSEEENPKEKESPTQGASPRAKHLQKKQIDEKASRDLNTILYKSVLEYYCNFYKNLGLLIIKEKEEVKDTDGVLAYHFDSENIIIYEPPDSVGDKKTIIQNIKNEIRGTVINIKVLAESWARKGEVSREEMEEFMPEKFKEITLAYFKEYSSLIKGKPLGASLDEEDPENEKFYRLKKELFDVLTRDMQEVIAAFNSTKEDKIKIETLDMETEKKRIFSAISIAILGNKKLNLADINEIFHPLVKEYYNKAQLSDQNVQNEKLQKELKKSEDSQNIAPKPRIAATLNDPKNPTIIENKYDNRFDFCYEVIEACMQFYTDPTYIVTSYQEKAMKELQRLGEIEQKYSITEKGVKQIHSALLAYIEFAHSCIKNKVARRITSEPTEPYLTFFYVLKKHVITLYCCIDNRDRKKHHVAQKLKSLSTMIKGEEDKIKNSSSLMPVNDKNSHQNKQPPKKPVARTNKRGKKGKKRLQTGSNKQINSDQPQKNGTINKDTTTFFATNTRSTEDKTEQKEKGKEKEQEISVVSHRQSANSVRNAPFAFRHQLRQQFWHLDISADDTSQESVESYISLLNNGLDACNYKVSCIALSYLIDAALGLQQKYMGIYKIYHPQASTAEQLFYLSDLNIAERAKRQREEILKVHMITDSADDKKMSKAIYYYKYFKLFFDLHKDAMLDDQSELKASLFVK
jgi:hypothetical protein